MAGFAFTRSCLTCILVRGAHKNMKPIAVYIHIPFCIHKCSYCDFNSYAGLDHLTIDFCDAVKREIWGVHELERVVSSVFFGGGTPTYLQAEQLNSILNAVRDVFPFAKDAEITSESNPANSDVERFEGMRRGGFNRLSIGVQSFDDRLLRIAERQHTSQEAIDAIACARSAGFDNLNLDMIFALPEQSLEDWRASLFNAIEINPEHISTYALSIEEGTRFDRMRRNHTLHKADEDTELEMYELAIELLSKAGYQHYEVSNFCRPGKQARHNLTYWLNEEYLGFGPGAVSYLGGRRWMNEKRPTSYIQKVKAGEPLAILDETLPPEEALAETLILGLRLRGGVTLKSVQDRFSIDLQERYSGLISELVSEGFAELKGDNLRLTHKGLLFSNDVFIRILP